MKGSNQGLLPFFNYSTSDCPKVTHEFAQIIPLLSNFLSPIRSLPCHCDTAHIIILYHNLANRRFATVAYNFIFQPLV